MDHLTRFLLLGGQAAAAGGSPPTLTQNFLSFAPLILIIGVFYFLIIRPQNKRKKETQKMLTTLKKGDKIVTIGGVMGTIATVDDKNVVIKVDDSTKIKFLRSAIASVESQAKEETPKIEDKKDDADASLSAEDKKDDVGGSTP
jgi:preprotein translocase subunit YajC